MTQMKQESEGASYWVNEKNQWLSLPTELTTAIFLICHAMDSMVLHAHPQKNPTLPIEFVLSSVCSHWRVLVLYLPALWKRFRFAPNNGVEVYPPKKLDTYEKRSGGRLEDIYLNLSQADYKPEGVKFISDVFRRHSQFLRRFVLIGGCNFKMYPYLPNLFPDASAPNLEYLALIAALDTEDTVEATVIEDFKISQFTNGAPKLKYLFCDGAVPGLGFPPIANLSTLRIEGDEFNYIVPFDVLRSLLSLPLLENLSLRMPDLLRWPGQNTPTTPITMLRLRNLRLCGVDPLLPLLFAPALEFVTLKNMYFSPFPAQKASNSFANVHDLTVISCKTKNPPHCWVYHALFPSVRSLTVAGNVGGFCPVQFFEPWSSLRNLTVDQFCKHGLVKLFEPTSANLKLRVPRTMLPAWQKANKNDSFALIESLKDGEPVVPTHWPRDDLESQGFAVTHIDWFCVRGSNSFP